MFLIRRRRRFCLLIVGSLIFISFFISEKLIVTPSNWNFLEVNSCPKCFGIDLCPSLNNGNFRFTGLSRISLFHGNSLNIKNVYTAVDSYFRAVRMKKLAHETEWKRFDQEKTNVDSSTDLFPCSINTSSSNEFRSAFVALTGLEPIDGEIAFETTLKINPEPILLSRFSWIDANDIVEMPFPSFYGACGRVIVVSDEGANFVSYLHASFPFRAFLAQQLLLTVHQLIIQHPQWILYYPDVNLENFVYNQQQQRVKIVDLEYLIVVPRSTYRFDDSSVDKSNRFCREYLVDYNIEQVCRQILSPKTNENIETWNFLHGIPNEVEKRWNLTDLLRKCSETSWRDERMKSYENLVEILKLVGSRDEE